MNPKLTTITCYWSRPEVLDMWVEAMRHCTLPQVEHLLFVVGEEAPPIPSPPAGLRIVEYPKTDPFSIGHCHNNGARIANSEWIMKLDVDTIPCLGFFRELLVVLEEAGPRDWYNVGMIYLKAIYNHSLLTKESLPVAEHVHKMICNNLRVYSSKGYHNPSATNFVCRTQDYIDLGGCDTRFDGYGWEDYQQIYMLERYERGCDPLPGNLHEANVTQRCRDEISRPKALELFRRNQRLALLHRHHAPSRKEVVKLVKNRKLLFDYISERRS